MPEFKYSAKTADGKMVKGMITANDEESFFSEVKSRKIYLLKYGMVNTQAGSKVLGQEKQLPLKSVAIFCRQTASLLKVGVSLVKAIDLMYQQTTNKAMKDSIKKIYESVQKGSLLSESLRKQPGKYPPIMISLVESGEASGMLGEAIEKLAAQFENDLKLKRKVNSAMVYPIIIAVLGIGVVVLMVTVVLPQFIKMFEQAGITKLPLPTAILIGLSHLVTNDWYYLVFGILVVVISVRMLLKMESGRLFWDGMKFKLPVSKQIIPRMLVVRFCRTFSTLLSSGMPMLQALSIVTNVMNNKAIAAELTETGEDIRKGMSLTQAIRRVSVFPPMLQSMVSIGEESGSLESMLEKTSEYYDAELESAIARMVAMIEPVMIIIMAVVVGFIILSVMLPMLQVYKSI